MQKIQETTDESAIANLTQEAAKFATIANNNLINALLCALFMVVTCLVLIRCVMICLRCVNGEKLPITRKSLS